VNGGTEVTVTGTGFLDGATVQFDGEEATDVVFVSSTELTCVTPVHAGGLVDVQVTNPNSVHATLVDGYGYWVVFTSNSLSDITPNISRQEWFSSYPDTIDQTTFGSNGYVGKDARPIPSLPNRLDCRRMRYECGAGMKVVPAHVVGGYLSICIQAKDEDEPLGGAVLRLAKTGQNWLVSSTWEVENNPVLLGVASSIPAVGQFMNFPLSGSILNANVGNDMFFLMSTGVEEAKGGGIENAWFSVVEINSTLLLFYSE
jgi:hypothetical protein